MMALHRFLKELKGLAEDIERIEITAKELHPTKDDRYVPFDHVQAALEQLLVNIDSEVSVKVREFKKSYDFHDRTIDAVVIDADGCSKTLRYDLTGGIDHLMDVHRETKVFRYWEERS